ncbi:MAG: HD domain-containing protein [Acidimicrobiales bacterium]|nr:HD domain-containing protein [Acidimicrobiales bacterium]
MGSQVQGDHQSPRAIGGGEQRCLPSPRAEAKGGVLQLRLGRRQGGGQLAEDLSVGVQGVPRRTPRLIGKRGPFVRHGPRLPIGPAARAVTARWQTGRVVAANGGIRRAHGDSFACVAPAAGFSREEREALESAALAVGATRALGAGRRADAEEADPFRTCFERDRDRILHSSAFRRLAGKTQVFVNPLDHQRTRLTHALEVAQVATSVARACRLNVALAEAIALGHDCGHGPFGHASEEALSPYLAGGYDHAVWGADVVLAPANLCLETLDGIRNHSWSRPAPATPEGEVVSFADRIAYVCHDFEDAVAAGVVSPQMLPEVVRRRCGERRGEQLDTFITGLIGVVTVTGEVGLPPDLAEALAVFRDDNYERIYLRPASMAWARSVVDLLRALVEHYCDRPNLIPDAAPSGLAAGGQEALRAAVTYVAGMTDRFAFTRAAAELGWDARRLPAEVP